MDLSMDMIIPNFARDPGMPHDDMPHDDMPHDDMPQDDMPGDSNDNSNNQISDGQGHSNHNQDGAQHGMSPFLFTRSTGFFVLFEGAFIESDGAFAGALLLSGLFALIATVLSQFARIHENAALRGSTPLKFAGATMHAFRQTLHYFAMLIVMTMNIWLIIAVVVGHGLGWLIFALVFGKKVAEKEEELQGKALGQEACDC